MYIAINQNNQTFSSRDLPPNTYKWYQQIEEDLKCMEPGAQNAQWFAFFSYDIAKLTKNDKFPSVLYKVNGTMFEKNCFFSVSKMLPTKFLPSLHELHC